MTKPPESRVEKDAPDVTGAKERHRLALVEVRRLEQEAADAEEAVGAAKANATSPDDIDSIEAAEFTAKRATLAVELAQRAVETARRDLDTETVRERAVVLARAEARRDALLAEVSDLTEKLSAAGDELRDLYFATKKACEWTDPKNGVKHRIKGFYKEIPLNEIKALHDWSIGYVRPVQW
jgi:hypothetical protein